MPLPVFICDDCQLTRTELSSMGVTRVPFIDGNTIKAVLGLDAWPDPITQDQVSKLLAHVCPAGYAGPIMWDEEAKQYHAMLYGSGAEQRAGEKQWESRQDKGRVSRSKGIHCPYLAASHLFPPGEYQGWMANTQPDRWALFAYRFGRIVELVDEAATGLMMSVYVPGWNPAWSDAQNLDEIERYARDCLAAPLEAGSEFNRPVYAIVNDRMEGHRAPLSEAALRAQVRGAMKARSLSGTRSITGIVYWNAETYLKGVEEPTMTKAQREAHAKSRHEWTLRIILSEVGT